MEPVNEENKPLEEPIASTPVPPKKKSISKVIWSIVALVLLIGGWFGYKLLNPESAGPRIHPFNLIPTNALYILETKRPYGLWSEISKTSLWHLLEEDEDWSEYGTMARELEEMLSDFDQALDILANRTVYISGHPYRSKDTDLLVIADLEGLGVLRAWMTSLEQITQREFEGKIIYEQLDLESKETLYFSFVDNYLIASYTHTLVEASLSGRNSTSLLRSFDFLDVHKKVINEGSARVYFNYDPVYKYVNKVLGDEGMPDIQQVLPFKHSGLFFDVEQEAVFMDGFSSYEDSVYSYLNLFSEMGTGGTDISEVLPDQTSVYMSFGFDSFRDFYVEMDKHVIKDKENSEDYQTYSRRTERFLDIDIEEDIADWVDDEIAFVQFEQGESSETAFIVKAKSADLATEKMAFLSHQIKRKTPVRFKTVDYRGYPINFMAVKGFFSLMLGNLFTKYDRPYFTIIDQFIVFSDTPQVLRGIIDKKIARETLAATPEFQEFIEKLGREHSGLIYLHLELLQNSSKGLMDEEMSALLQSKTSIISKFPQIGINITPDGEMFRTHFLVSIEAFETSEVSMDSAPIEHLGFNLDSLFQSDPGEQIVIEEIEVDDLTAKKQSEDYEEGGQKYELQIKDGLKHGSYYEYHPTGELKVKGKYKNDLKDGTWKYYTVDGKLERREKYKKGELVVN